MGTLKKTWINAFHEPIMFKSIEMHSQNTKKAKISIFPRTCLVCDSSVLSKCFYVKKSLLPKSCSYWINESVCPFFSTGIRKQYQPHIRRLMRVLSHRIQSSFEHKKKWIWTKISSKFEQFKIFTTPDPFIGGWKWYLW